MNALIERQSGQVEAIDVCEIIRNKLSSLISEQNLELAEKKILEKYFYNFEHLKGDVDSADIYGDILDYNEEIIYDISEMEYDAGYYGDDYFSGVSSSDDRHERICEIQSGNMEMYSFDHLEGLEKLMSEVLEHHKLYYKLSETTDAYSLTIPDSNCYVTINDCQQILFEFHHEDINSDLDYHNEFKGEALVWSK